jgi:hypothetical protein
MLILLLVATPVLADDCPVLPDLPDTTEKETEFQAAWQWVSEPYSVYEYVGSRDQAPLGVGHLRVEYTDHGYYDWPRKVVLPIWQAPGGALLAWLRSGLVFHVDGTAFDPLSGLGMVETDYEQLTIIITEVQGDWLKLRFKDGGDGVGWVHRCYLDIGEVGLAYQSWQELLTEKGDWLHFRSEVPHSLRAEPSVQSERVTMIGRDHKLKLLQIEGDWMQVEVTQPDWTCTGPDQTFKGTTHRGWVRWRDDQVGPRAWYYTRGC